MTTYLTRTLCPRLRIAPDFEVVELPIHGLRSEVLLVRTRSTPAFVLRFIRKPAEGEQLLAQLRFAQTKGLPTPRLVNEDLSRTHVKEHGFGVIVEELIEGEHRLPAEATAENRRALGAAMARFHSVENAKWGAPDKLRGSDFFTSSIQSKFENRLSSIAKHDPEFEKSARAKIVGFVKSMRKAWDGGPPFGLTHDKINTGNVTFTPDNEARFLDLATMRFGATGKDLAAALYYFAPGEAEEAELKQAYFDALPERHADHFARFEPLYRAWHHLSRWASKSRAYAKRSKKEDGDSPTASRSSMNRERDAMWEWIECGEK